MAGQSAETIGQARICRIKPALGQDGVWNDNGPGPERWIQPTGQTKADEGIRAPIDQPARGVRGTGWRASACQHRVAEARGNPSLRRQTNNET